MLVIGITGPTGCGKTTLLQQIERRGGYIVDCDALYYELLKTDPALKARLADLCDHQPFIAKAPLVLVFLADCRRWLNAYYAAGIEDARAPGAGDLLLAMGDGFAATDMQPLNRLDRDTTGVVLFSLDKQTQPAFDQMVIDHAFEKHYLALAEGKIDWNEKLIDKPIARDRHDSRKMRVGASGKPSQTRVKVLKRLKSRRGLPTRSYIDVELLTGRKHQIRVHLASECHPLVGDDLYGTPRPCGLMLHAHSVSFTHPVTGEHIHIEAPCPWEP